MQLGALTGGVSLFHEKNRKFNPGMPFQQEISKLYCNFCGAFVEENLSQSSYKIIY